MFISHNKADTEFSAILAKNLMNQGAIVWFDKWDIRPGDSIIGGISRGIENAEVFILIWSENAARSKWVGTEIRSILRRRVDNETLRIIPIMLDETTLPVLVAEYSGFKVDDKSDLDEIAKEICGAKPDNEVVRILQNRLEEIAGDPVISAYGYTYYCCPKCGSKNLKGLQSTDYENDRSYFGVECGDCGWNEGGEI